MSVFSLLYPVQPTETASVLDWGAIVSGNQLRRLWLGQSFSIDSHMALAALAGKWKIPVAVGTALAPLRSPYEAAVQARSLALLLDQEVSVAYGAADPDFVRGITGAPLKRPASFTAEYARLVKLLVNGEHAQSTTLGTTMSARLPPLGSEKLPRIRIGTGVLREGMARKSCQHIDFAVSWLTPDWYIESTLGPALTRSDGTRPEVATIVPCAVDRPGRNPMLLAQLGLPHLRRHHYVDMLQRSGLDVHLSDPVAGARVLVDRGVFAYGSATEIAQRLAGYFAAGIDEVVINVAPVALIHGLGEALRDISELLEHLPKKSED